MIAVQEHRRPATMAPRPLAPQPIEVHAREFEPRARRIGRQALHRLPQLREGRSQQGGPQPLERPWAGRKRPLPVSTTRPR